MQLWSEKKKKGRTRDRHRSVPLNNAILRFGETLRWTASPYNSSTMHSEVVLGQSHVSEIECSTATLIDCLVVSEPPP